jgi:hypothetical protein
LSELADGEDGGRAGFAHGCVDHNATFPTERVQR